MDNPFELKCFANHSATFCQQWSWWHFLSRKNVTNITVTSKVDGIIIMTSSWRHNVPVLGWPFRLNNLKLLDPKIESSLGGWYSKPFLRSKNIISALEKPFNMKLILIMISMLCHIFFNFSKKSKIFENFAILKWGIKFWLQTEMKF